MQKQPFLRTNSTKQRSMEKCHPVFFLFFFLDTMVSLSFLSIYMHILFNPETAQIDELPDMVLRQFFLIFFFFYIKR